MDRGLHWATSNARSIYLLLLKNHVNVVACVYPLSAWYLEAGLRQRTLRQTRLVERAETDVNPSYSTTLWLTDLD